MSGNKYFQFKQFRIEQHHTAMKVNTDGVLLGAWANVKSTETVLDIGTGTGLIALMIAQRCNAFITGIEIDEQAALEAAENAKKSPWTNRILVKYISFQQFTATHEGKFDLVISNPPFFSNSVKNNNPRLSMARHNHKLPFSEMISGTLSLLAPGGRLAVILPVDEAEKFAELADSKGLFVSRKALVKPFPEKEPNRTLMEISRIKTEPEIDCFSIYDESRKNYSSEFIRLAADFYLRL